MAISSLAPSLLRFPAPSFPVEDPVPPQCTVSTRMLTVHYTQLLYSFLLIWRNNFSGDDSDILDKSNTLNPGILIEHSRYISEKMFGSAN